MNTPQLSTIIFESYLYTISFLLLREEIENNLNARCSNQNGILIKTMTTKSDKKCIICRLDLNTQKSFKEREDWETVKFCSSKCRKTANNKRR